MSAINIQKLSIQQALEIFYEDDPETQEKINSLAREILTSFQTNILRNEPFLTLVTLTLSAEEIINKKTGDNLDLASIPLKRESIAKLLQNSGNFISINGHPYRL